jgi:hypothetical protein
MSLVQPGRGIRPGWWQTATAFLRSRRQPARPAWVACTVVAKTTLPSARVLAESFHAHHREIPFFVLLADEIDGCFSPERESFSLLKLDDLKIPNLSRFRFHYGQQELTYAATPYLITALLDRGFGCVGFFKQESLVVGNLKPILDRVGECSIALTPHLLEALEGEQGIARELNILLSGIYNVGFVGVADTSSARTFLAWWQDRLYLHCRHMVTTGMHYEQRWLDLVPSLFDGVQILDDPGFNIGHWNLPERRVTLHRKKISVNGSPARYFRFSGFEPERPTAVTRYSARLATETLGPAGEVFRRYRELLLVAGYQQTKSWPYAYGHFDNGVPVPDIVRLIYRELGDAVGSFGDPLKTSAPGSYFKWLVRPEHEHNPNALTNLWRAIYDRRPDLQHVFPDPSGHDHESFITWTRKFGTAEYKLPDSLLMQ